MSSTLRAVKLFATCSRADEKQLNAAFRPKAAFPLVNDPITQRREALLAIAAAFAARKEEFARL